MTQIIPIGERTYEQIAEEKDRLRIEAEISRQEIISLNAENESLRRRLLAVEGLYREQQGQLEAIGAGGVSARRISGSAE